MISQATIVLSMHQRHLLWRALAQIQALGQCGFVLEVCIAYHPGHSITWESDGSPDQEDEIDRVMSELSISIHDN